jgi:D-serine dehydratase
MTNLKINENEYQLIINGMPLLWLNTAYQDASAAPAMPGLAELHAAEARLTRFGPLLQQLFPELQDSDGIIESPLLKVDRLNSTVNTLGGALYLKADHALPVAGSIKARGGIHEVLCVAESLALEQGLIKDPSDDYRLLGSSRAKELFSEYHIVVGSTGNLGLSIGIIGAALGFTVIVHMSSDAKEWKKTRLRKRGVTVIEHDADYGAAVAAGRSESNADPHSYFIDDEKSPYLFMGYAVAAIRLQKQLADAGIRVDAEHPLFVYLPAGVGGAPGGITFGLKNLFGKHVHCFFAEPVQAPCMLLGMAGAAGSRPATIYDLGLHLDTDADGLAVGTASQWVCDATRSLVSGVYTATDTQLFQQLYQLKTQENIAVEPSAAIGCLGPSMLNNEAGRTYLAAHDLTTRLHKAAHIAWLTGGSFVPDEEHRRYLEKAISLSA